MTALKTAAAALAVLLTVAASANGCEHQEQLAKCEKAYRTEWRRALEDQDEGRPPRECRGISKKDMRRILERALREDTPRLDPETGEVTEP